MSRWFELHRIGDYHSITPSIGEELGAKLAKFAAEEMERCIANPNLKVEYWGNMVAQLFHLAADAYEAGASVTIGHNRADRYETAARSHRSMAETLTHQAKLFRDQARSSRLMVAFQDGYQGLKGDRYAFDDRKAFQLGQHFAKEGFDIPEVIKYLYATGGDQFDIDGEIYKVEYPTGKVNDPAIIHLD